MDRRSVFLKKKSIFSYVVWLLCVGGSFAVKRVVRIINTCPYDPVLATSSYMLILSFLLESGPLVEYYHSFIMANQWYSSRHFFTIVRRRLCRSVDRHHSGGIVTDTVMRALWSWHWATPILLLTMSNWLLLITFIAVDKQHECANTWSAELTLRLFCWA